MNFKWIFVFLIAFMVSSFTILKDLNKKVDKEIKETFKVVTYSYKAVTFTPEINKQLPSKFETDNFLQIITNQKPVGYVYMGKAPSKTDDFDYLVILDTDLIVLNTKILAYREDYGAEIGSKRWLRQFEGKSRNDDLRYGDNIAAISGATISVRSMTNAMNNLLKSLKMLHSKNVL